MLGISELLLDEWPTSRAPFSIYEDPYAGTDLRGCGIRQIILDRLADHSPGSSGEAVLHGSWTLLTVLRGIASFRN